MVDTANPVTNPLGALQALTAPIINRSMEEYERNKQQLDLLKQMANRAPEYDAAERWAAMAQAAARVPPITGAFGQLLASIGGAYGQALSAQEERNFARQQKIAELMDRTSGGLGTGATTAMVQAALNPIMNIGGVGINRVTGQMVVPKVLEDTYRDLYGKFYKQATEQKMPNPETWAHEQARYAIEKNILSNPSIAGSIYPQRPSNTPVPSQESSSVKPKEEETPAVDLPAKDIAPWIERLKRDEELAVKRGDYARALEVKKARQALEAELRNNPPPSLQYRDVARDKLRESTAEVTGKKLGEAYDALQTAGAAASDLKIHLNTLKDLYATPNLPEGELAEHIQRLRSSLHSLGVAVDKDALASGELISSIGSKLALLTRTADGNNLMPGAMSNFEQEILRFLVPTLKQSQQGRLALVDFLSSMADIRIRLAEEANKMAGANHGILPPEWYSRRDRILREERIKLKVKADELKRQFNKGSQ